MSKRVKKLNVKEAEIVLRKSMDEAIQQGWSIARWVTCSPGEKICCPLGAWGVANEVLIDNPEELAKAIGLWVLKGNQLVNGFDDRELPQDAPYKSWFRLGQRLAQEYHASNFYREKVGD